MNSLNGGGEYDVLVFDMKGIYETFYIGSEASSVYKEDSKPCDNDVRERGNVWVSSLLSNSTVILI